MPIHEYASSGVPAIWGETATNASPVYGLTTAGGWSAVYGKQTSAGGGSGVQGECTASSNGSGVYGNCPGNNSYGVYGIATGATSTYGVYGTSTAATNSNYGVGGRSTSGIGVSGISNTYIGMSASGPFCGINAVSGTGGPSSLAGNFVGNVVISANLLVSGTKSFAIDHPLDPENKVLVHACVESDASKVSYDGLVVADHNGEATISLPSYFDALATDARYQLTPIGGAAPNLHIQQEVVDNTFRMGAAPSRRPQS